MNPAQSQKFFKIGQAAKLLGLSSETLRRWERSGRITFSRTPGGKRLFSEADLETIRNILKPTQEPTQPVRSNREASTTSNETQTSTPSFNQSEKITLSVSIPKIKIPHLSFTKLSIALVVLILLGGNIFFFSQTPYPKQAVLGVETFLAPFVEEVSPILSPAVKFIGSMGNFIRVRASSFLLAPLPGGEERVTSFSLPEGIKVDGDNIILGIGREGTTTVNNNFEVLGSSVVQSLNVQGSLSVDGPTNLGELTVTNETVVGNLSLSSTTPQISIANTGVLKITDGTNTLIKLTDNGTTGNLQITGDLTVEKNITLKGVINSNTFTSTKLIFAGDSPSIYPGTTNTGISLNGNGTGAVNIGNSGTGDIYIAGGSSDTGCTITNSNGTLNCSGNITSQADIDIRGGDLTTNQTTFSLINATATTLNIGNAATTLSIGASSGTTTINNATTASSLVVTGNINSSSGSLQTNGVTRIDNSGNLTAGTGSFAGHLTPSLDATYDLGSSSLRWANIYVSSDVNVGDLVFKNNFRFTEDEDRGIHILNPKGEVIGGFDYEGNLWMKGEIKQWGKN